MGAALHPDLAAVADLVDLADTLTVAGHPCPLGPESVDGAIVEEWPDDAEQPSGTSLPASSPEALLAAALYRHCYLRAGGDEPPRADPVAEREFQAALSRVNSGRGTWETGWSFAEGEADGRIVLARRGVRFWARPEDVQEDIAGLEAGQPCRVRVPAEYRFLLPGFYMMVGDAASRDEGPDAGLTLRLYWHLTSAAAPRLIAAMARELNAVGVPFRAKLLARPQAYRRADAGVLYLAKADFVRARAQLEGIYAEVGSGLRAEVPLFTKRLAPGLGIAEGPEDGRSFGQHRCRIVARGLLTAQEDGCADARGKREALAAAFLAEGLDPQAPWLRPGSSDAYGLAGSRSVQRRESRDGGMRRDDAPAAPEGALLAAAVRIGRALCSEAHWDRARERCAWMGRSNRGAGAPGPAATPTTEALGPEVYGGLSGTALFLAELFAQTGEAVFGRTAAGAIRCALEQLHRGKLSRPGSLGFYTGPTGVALALMRVNTSTGAPGADAATRLVADAWRKRPRAGPDDLLGGRAGAILALLELNRQTADPRFVEWAAALGQELLEPVLRGPSNAHPAPADEPHLTGLSHGAAGIGLALLELHAATGDERFLVAGRQVIDAEDARFDPQRGNWPDLRTPRTPDVDPSRPRFAVAWCHGAPGIALSRLRASRLDLERREGYEARARAALETTRRHLELRRPAAAFDVTPCHGTAGLIEALWVGGLVLDEPRFRAAALTAAWELIEAATAGETWRSGILCGGPNPSLMVGTAGLGYQFLRLADPRGVPSVLTGASG